MLAKRSVILAKIEPTYNSPGPDPVAADAILVENIQVALEGARMYERLATKPSFGSLNSLYGGSLMSLSFDMEIKGSGDPAVPPECGVPLRACGLGQTIPSVAPFSVTYAPVSTALDSATFHLFEDGLRYVLTGCRGTVTCNMTVGEPGKLSFSFTGHFAGPTDLALPATTYDPIVPVIALNLSGFLVDGFAAKISALSFDLANEVGTPDDLTAEDGFGEVSITGRKMTGSIDPLATLVADYDWVAKWKASTTASLATGTLGSTAGNIYAISMPSVQYTEIGSGDRAGVLTRDISFMAGESVADDEVSLVFT